MRDSTHSVSEKSPKNVVHLIVITHPIRSLVSIPKPQILLIGQILKGMLLAFFLVHR
jgi:hypothetical protein